jgi:hypothetical protein
MLCGRLSRLPIKFLFVPCAKTALLPAGWPVQRTTVFGLLLRNVTDSQQNFKLA